MKSAIILLCFIFSITVSKKAQVQLPVKKTSAQTVSANQKAKTSHSAKAILMDEKNHQKERTVPVRTNSGSPQKNRNETVTGIKTVADSAKNRLADIRNKPQRN